MFRYEFTRLWHHRMIWCLLGVLLIVNGVLFYKQYDTKSETAMYSASEYVQVWERLSEVPREERQTLFEDLSRDVTILYQYVIGFSEEELIKKYDSLGQEVVCDLLLQYNESPEEMLFTDNIYAEKQLFDAIRSEVETVLEYPEHRKDMQNRSEVLLGSILAEKQGGYNVRNLKKTLHDYQKSELPEIDGIYDNSKGVEAVSFPVSSICVLLLIAFSVGELFLYEKEQGLEALVRTNVRGKIPRLHGKMIAVSVFSIIVGTVFFIESVVLSQTLYGLGDLQRPIQTVVVYVSAVEEYSVAQFLIALYIVRIFVFVCVAWILTACTIFMRNTWQLMLLTVTISGLEYGLYFAISETSFLSVLKFVNIAKAIQGHELLATYRNINIFGTPITEKYVVLGLCFFLFVLSYVMLLFNFSRRYTLTKSFASQNSLQRQNGSVPVYTTSLWKQELFRISILNKSALFLLFFVVFLWLWSVREYEPLPVSKEEAYYQEYISDNLGPITEETDIYIHAEKERFELLQDQIDELEEKIYSMAVLGEQKEAYSLNLEMMILRNQMAPRDAFERFCSYVNYLKGMKEAYIVDERSYEEMYLNFSSDIEMAFLITIGLLFILPPVFTVDRESQLIEVIGACGNVNKLRRIRLLVSGSIAALLAVIPRVARWSMIEKTYSVPDIQWGYTANSVRGLSAYGDIPLSAYAVYVMVLGIVGSIALALAIIAIVHIFNRVAIKWLALGTLVVLPFIAALLFAPIGRLWFHLACLIGSSFMAEMQMGERIAAYCVTVLVGIGAFAIIRRRFSRI